MGLIRLRFVVLVGLLSVAAAVNAQPSSKLYRVGIVLTTSPTSEMIGSQPAHGGISIFLRELESLGYVEGRNVVVERRSAEGKPERYKDIIAELISLKVDVVVTVGNTMTRRAKELTSTVPIVMNFSVDPVGSGLVNSLSRPGGNITGMSVEAGAQLDARRLALLKEAAPNISKVAFLGTKEDWEGPEGRSARTAAEQLGLVLFHAESTPNGYSAAFAAIDRERADAMFVSSSPPQWVHRKAIAEYAVRRKLPSAHLYWQSVESGGLMSYGSIPLNCSSVQRRM
jgi:putative ABC transport system substrate-binding protein